MKRMGRRLSHAAVTTIADSPPSWSTKSGRLAARQLHARAALPVQGLGYEIAKALLSCGCKVIVATR